ncbi:MAG: molybdopterin-guanine dinucleotide biosynthesis protein A [Granulosicoccus sp.]|jgi:molybdopterin-guanine dinucleotide biosynthesis protein A
MKHQKHTKLTRPNVGEFGRSEWAVIGTPCGNIQQLSYRLIEVLHKTFKVSYVDADHKNEDEPKGLEVENPALALGATLEYTDKISHHRFDLKSDLNTFQYRTLFNEQDLVLVNGNHFKAKHQIVVIDPKKEKSLEKKLDRLTNVDLILMTGEEQSIYPFLKNHLKDWAHIPVLHFSQTEKIAEFILVNVLLQVPKLNGLVLAGGKSVRMGKDKGALDYHGKPQREFMADMLSQFCEKTYISVRENQGVESEYELLEDTFVGLGPFGAIASAMRKNPNTAWLVVACDLPLLDEKTLQFLVENRNASKVATAIYNPETDFPEPLITIWEPRSYQVMLNFLAQGYSCPRKVLINSEIELLKLENVKVLLNVNDAEAYDKIKGM